MLRDEAARYLRVKDVAARFDVSPSTIYRAIEAGELEAVRIGGTVRIAVAAVALYENRGESGAAPAGVA